MKTGLIIGKFMPLHNGHILLVDFAKKHCDILHIAFCYSMNETISGNIREKWLTETFGNDRKIKIITLLFDESVLPNTSVSSKEVSKKWAGYLLQSLPQMPDIIFSSEAYGNYLAEYMDVQHMLFDEKRIQAPVSATQIRNTPFNHWNHIPVAVRPYFVKKIAIIGSESTGKSILTEKLAASFNTCFVKEMARDIIEHTERCTSDHLYQIADLHARTILLKEQKANKLLFSDTELCTTKSYSRFLFNKNLNVEQWIENANRFDLYLFLETDCLYVQDGTRLAESERNKLSEFHKQQLTDRGINFITITGSWDQRLEKACSIVKNKLLNG